MKPLRWISPILICLVVVGFGLFGVKYRSTYTDLTAQPNYKIGRASCLERW